MAHSWSFGNDVPPDSRSGITDGGGALKPGARFGPYEIHELLGEGSTGRVYKARDPRGALLALKVVKARLDEGRRERFLREGAVLNKLQHPGIVRVLTGGEVEGVPFLACELVDAPDAFRKVLENASVRERVRMVRDLADAVGHAHARGIVHRDLKPENVLVDTRGRPRLTDLGLALAGGADRLTQTGEVLGTPLYMAPEQTEAGARLGPPCDVWALGVILYEAITGALPFRAEGWIELRALIRKAAPAPPRQINPQLPVALESCCLRALAPTPADRFPNGVALARALDPLLRAISDEGAGPALAITADDQRAPQRTPFGLGRHGRFEVIEELGRGGMGIVYRALDTELGREVALKVILSARGNARRLERFRREGELTANLKHPGILNVHSMGVMDDAPYIVYELVENAKTLDRVLQQVDRQAALELVRDAARALGHAHAQGVIHRDVKPDNLLVDGDGRLLVSDFGLAAGRNVERLTRTGAVVGTPRYMAPEQAAGERDRVGPHTDVWGLGVILYELLCNAFPFEGGNFVELSAAIVNKHPVAPRAHDPTIAKDLEAICLKALNKAPAGRYQDGAHLAEDLDAYFAGRPTTATSAGLLLPRLRQSPRALLAVPLFVSAALLIAALAWGSRRGPEPNVAPVISKQAPADPHDKAWEQEGERAWRDIDHAPAGLAAQLAEARTWLERYAGHPLEAEAQTLVTRLRFAAPRRLHVLRHSPKGRCYGVFLENGELLTFGAGRAIRRWNGTSGALIASYPVPGQSIRSLVPIRGSTRFVAGRPGELLWGELRAGEFRPTPLVVTAPIVASPNGRAVAAPCLKEVVELDLESETELRRYDGFDAPPTAITYSPDGARLVVFTGEKGPQGAMHEFLLYDTANSALLVRQQFNRVVRAVAFGPDGTVFAGTNTGTLFALDGTTGETIGSLESADETERREFLHSAHRGSIKGIAFAPDGSVLYTVSQGGIASARDLRLWDVASRTALRPPILRPYNLDGLALSSDGARFAIASEAGVVEVWSRE